ncbi:hypothetical protein D3C81_541240 [compost metagenome]
MADFHGVAQARITRHGRAAVALQAFGGVVRKAAGGFAVAWQLGQKVAEALRVEFQIRGKLPQEGAQLVTQQQGARREEVGKRLVDFAQPAYVGDVARRLDREHEPLRCLVTPLGIALGRLQCVERTVDFDAVDCPRGKRQLVVLAQPLGVEVLAPWAIAPTGNSDADLAHHKSLRSCM